MSDCYEKTSKATYIPSLRRRPESSLRTLSGEDPIFIPGGEGEDPHDIYRTQHPQTCHSERSEAE